MGLLARPLQAEDEDEARDEGRQARNVRQGLHRQGEAREEGGEGFPGQGPQGQHLKRGNGGCLEPSAPSVECRGVNRQEHLGSRARWVLVTQRLYMLAELRASKK